MNKRVCIFVDGENLRHSIVKLFPEFDKRTYLPRADWTALFDWVTEKSLPGAERVRTYWYVVKKIDFSPPNFEQIEKEGGVSLLTFLQKDVDFKRNYESASDEQKPIYIQDICKVLHSRQDEMRKRSRGWENLHEVIEGSTKSVEFRKVGTIRYDLLKKELGDEKAVDVHLAVDMVTLKDIYDVAVILSGDQDYVPAVKAVKDFGKQVVNVAFKREDGKLLPGGAKRLGQTTDWCLEVSHEDLKKFMNFKK
jgi:uncharacterized LabA/DUF88 family protein